MYEILAEYHAGYNLWCWKTVEGAGCASILNFNVPDEWHLITDYAINGVVSLKRLLNQSNLKSWSSKMIKKSLEAYFFTLKNKIVFCKKQFQNMSVFCFVSTEIV